MRKPLARVVREPITILAIGLFLLMVFVEASAYEGRKDVVHSQRAGCERGQIDKVDQINASWYSHVADLLATQSMKSDPVTRVARGVEDRAEQIYAVEVSHQIELSHASSLPKPLRRYATFSCLGAYPAASIWP